MMIGFDVKKHIQRNVQKTMEEFAAREDIVTKFGTPLIGYVDARHPLFNIFMDKNMSDHPKNIYRPGITLIIHAIPYDMEAMKSNEENGAPSPQWVRAFTESTWLSMAINRAARGALDMAGRLSSCLNTPMDWNEKTFRGTWSHKLAAYAAGMGDFGPAESFRTADGCYGLRVGSLITDGKYAEEVEPMSDEQLEAAYLHILRSSMYQEADGISCSAEMIAACPGNAISEKGIDRAKCQAYCKTIDEYIPCPDVCGKCFRFK